MKSKWLAALKTGLALGLLAFLLSRLDNRSDLVEAWRRASRHPGALLAAFGLFGLSLLACYLRWVALLKALALPIPLPRSAYLFALGHAGNLLLPGGFAGDLIKAAALTRDPSLHRAKALISLMADRLIGLFWLLVLVLIATLLHGRLHGDHAAMRLLTLALMIGLALSVITTLAVSWFALARPAPETPVGFNPKRWLRWLAEIVRQLSTHPATALRTSLYSVVNHLGQAACAVCLAAAVGVRIEPLTVAFERFLTANLLTIIPVTPGGLGVREIAFPWLLAQHGVTLADGMAISLLFFGMMLAWALLCTLPWLFNGLRLMPADAPGAADPDRAPPA